MGMIYRGVLAGVLGVALGCFGFGVFGDAVFLPSGMMSSGVAFAASGDGKAAANGVPGMGEGADPDKISRPCGPEYGPRIFRNLCWDMSVAKVQELAAQPLVKRPVEFANPQKNPEDALLEDWHEEGVYFAGLQWTGVYHFKSGKLRWVELLGRDNFLLREERALQALTTNGFKIIWVGRLRKGAYFSTLEHKDMPKAEQQRQLAAMAEKQRKTGFVIWDLVEEAILSSPGSQGTTHRELFSDCPLSARGGGVTFSDYDEWEKKVAMGLNLPCLEAYLVRHPAKEDF